MAATETPVDFEVIETHKENIQSLPSGRSAKSLAAIFSPVATKSPQNTQDINDVARQEYEKELAAIDDSDDPLDVFDRYVKWTLNTYPTAQATPQSRLLPLLERATKTFLSSAHYKNDPRYLKLWLHYIRFFSDAPRETFAYLARHGIGQNLALFYEEFAAWLESAGRWTQAEEVYKMGIEREARPTERLLRKFGEFEKRFQTRPQDSNEPQSPALPTARPALAAKVDPFSVTSPDAADPQAASRRGGPATTKKAKLEIFADSGNAQQPAASSGAKGWDSIGTLAERKKENTVEARPWTGETIKSGPKAMGVPKMMIFKDQSAASMQRVQDHPSFNQRAVNPRSGRLECVFVNLEAVYPDPSNPSIEFCFEELRAARRGWLQRDWSRPRLRDDMGSLKPQRPVMADVSPQRQNLTQTVALNDVAEHMATKLPLNDENDENGPRYDLSPSQKKSIARKMRREEKANRTRKIKVREVQAETQTIQTNFDSPRGPKMKRKKSAEPTMTIHTKAANDEIYDLFNAPLKSETIAHEEDDDDDGDESDETSDSDDDYTSGGEDTNTGRISGATSEIGDDTRGDLAESRGAEGDENTADNTGWTEFDTKKDVLGRGDATVDATATASSGLPERTAADVTSEEDHAAKEEVVTPTSPNPPVQQHTFQIPIPPADIEAPTRPYRDPEQAAQRRLPFMTPIVEKTESSLGTATGKKEKDYFTAKTPCPKSGNKTPAIPEDDDGPLSSPFQDIFDDIKANQPISQPKLIEAVSTPKPAAETARPQPAPKVVKEVTSKGPVIKDQQCNPMDEQIRKTVLQEMHPPLSTYKGYFEHTSVDYNRRPEIRKFCKSNSNGKGSKNGNDRTSQTVQLPPVLAFEGAERQLTIKRELGAGAYAPVYLAEHADEEEEESESLTNAMANLSHGSRRRLEAVKMEDPPSAWEFYILRAAKRRLGVSRAADSIVDAYEMHLFRDEGYLIEEYRDQGTLLDLVNGCIREAAIGGVTGCGMEETLAMFFAVELFRTVEGLHSKGIIHGDLKADNVLVRFDDVATISTSEELSARYDRQGRGGWSAKGIALIDMGRGIDMRAFQPGVQFIADWPTGPTDCAEMQEMRPWTFQADYHGLAAIIHTMLFGKYIETVADKGMAVGAGAAKTYRLKESLKRYWQTEIWGEVFTMLLNSRKAAEAEDGSRLPALRTLKGLRERMETWLEANSEKGVGLRTLVKRAEALAAKGRR